MLGARSTALRTRSMMVATRAASTSYVSATNSSPPRRATTSDSRRVVRWDPMLLRGIVRGQLCELLQVLPEALARARSSRVTQRAADHQANIGRVGDPGIRLTVAVHADDDG